LVFVLLGSFTFIKRLLPYLKLLRPIRIALIIRMLDCLFKSSKPLDDRGKTVSWRCQNADRSQYVLFSDLANIFWNIRIFRWGACLIIIQLMFVIAIFLFLYIDEHSTNFPQQLHSEIITWLGYSGSVLGIALIFIFIFGISYGVIRQSICNYYLSQSLCPACQCDMRGQPVENDGCVVCANPKCGAAWKLTAYVLQP